MYTWRTTRLALIEAGDVDIAYNIAIERRGVQPKSSSVESNPDLLLVPTLRDHRCILAGIPR